MATWVYIRDVAGDLVSSTEVAADHSVEVIVEDDTPTVALWSDPATWGGVIPQAGDSVTLPSDVLLDVDAEVGSLFIPDGRTLEFNPDASVVLEVTDPAARVEVAGTLRMRPSEAHKSHVLMFSGIDESLYGGGDENMSTDPGMYVVANGVLDLVGSPKTAWVEATDGLTAGQETFTTPTTTGWLSGDKLAVAPTELGDWSFDEVFVGQADGALVELDLPLVGEHPSHYGFAPEVLNLHRNVLLMGSSIGRPHLVFVGSAPQTISNVEISMFGPEAPLGRYPLHFHKVGDASRGSVIDGVVVHDSRNRAFVPHGSHGITMTNCVAYDIKRSAFWWDRGDLADDSNDIVWDRCVAAKVTHAATSPKEKYTATGFYLVDGDNNVCRNCVAVGVTGNTGSSSNTSGYQWPEPTQSTGVGVWVFEDNLAHNCARNGTYIWQNTGELHDVTRFSVYHCGGVGVDLGAYGNSYQFFDTEIYGCPTAVVWHSLSRASAGRPALFDDTLIMDCNVGFRTVTHNTPGFPTEIRDTTFSNVAVPFLSSAQAERHPDSMDVYDWEGPVVVFDAGSHPDSEWRFHRADGSIDVARP